MQNRSHSSKRHSQATDTGNGSGNGNGNGNGRHDGGQQPSPPRDRGPRLEGERDEGRSQQAGGYQDRGYDDRDFRRVDASGWDANRFADDGGDEGSFDRPQYATRFSPYETEDPRSYGQRGPQQPPQQHQSNQGGQRSWRDSASSSQPGGERSFSSSFSSSSDRADRADRAERGGDRWENSADRSYDHRGYDRGDRGYGAGGAGGWGGPERGSAERGSGMTSTTAPGQTSFRPRMGGAPGLDRQGSPLPERTSSERSNRGPKGYKRSDQRIHEDVCDRLSDLHELDAGDIEVSVKDGEVTLTGSVPHRSMKYAAEHCCDGVPGVVDITNSLRVRRGGEGQHTVPTSSMGQQVSAGVQPMSSSMTPTSGERGGREEPGDKSSSPSASSSSSSLSGNGSTSTPGTLSSQRSDGSSGTDKTPSGTQTTSSATRNKA